MVEDYLKSEGYNFKWEIEIVDGKEYTNLRYTKTFPQVQEHILTKEKCWFNQIQAHHWTFYEGHPKFRTDAQRDGLSEKEFNKWPVTTRFGDGSFIPKDTLQHIRQVVWRNTA